MRAASFALALGLGLWAVPGSDGQAPGEDAAFSAVALPTAVAPGDAVLVVSGRMAPKEPVALDLETLLRMPRTKFSDIDPWDSRKHEFAGVELLPLLRRLGMDEKAAALEVSARNGYKVSIRMQDLKANGYLLAFFLDGKLLKDQPDLKKRGTLILALDFSRHPELDTEVYKFHLVWQVTSIAIR
jgi:hypothetical protein